MAQVTQKRKNEVIPLCSAWSSSRQIPRDFRLLWVSTQGRTERSVIENPFSPLEQNFAANHMWSLEVSLVSNSILEHTVEENFGVNINKEELQTASKTLPAIPCTHVGGVHIHTYIHTALQF